MEEISRNNEFYTINLREIGEQCLMVILIQKLFYLMRDSIR